MANKNINILLKLQDKFSDPLKKTNELTKKQKLQIKAADKVIKTYANNANKRFKKVAGAVGKVAAVIGTLGGLISIAGIKSWCSTAVEAAQAQVEAETKLKAILGDVKSIASGGTSAIDKANTRLLTLASNIQKVGVIGDEVTIAGMQQLATFQLSADSISELSTGMTDLIAQQKGLSATQSDAVTIANMIGKAMTGNATALSRVGITMTDAQKKIIKTGTETEKAATIAEVLQQNVGGVNAALASTDQGKIQQVKNLYGDMTEEVGKRLLQMKASLAGIAVKYIPDLKNAIMSIIDKVQPKVEAAVKYLEDHSEQIKKTLKQVGQTVGTAMKIVGKFMTFVIDHSEIMLPLLAGVAAAFTVVNAVMSVIAFMTPIITVIKGIALAFGTLELTTAAAVGIFLGVIAAIAAAIAIGVLLYKNWDKISAVAGALWDKIKTVFGGIRDAITGAFDAARESVAGFFDWIGDKLGALDKAISSVPVIGQLYTGFKNVASAAVSKIRGNATGTSYFSGGLTRVNEGGRGEIMNLPNGTQIVPHDVSTKAAGRSIVLNLRFIVQGNVIGNREFMEQTGKYVAEKVIEALPTV